MSLVNTLMQPLRSEYMESLDKNEARPSRYGAWDFANVDGARPESIFDQDLRNKIKGSIDNTVQVPVLDAKAVTIGNTRSCTIADDENTSQLVTLVFSTLSFGFTMIPGQYMNNDIKYQADFNRKLKRYLNALGASLDNLAIAALENNKNQFWTGIDPAYYSQVGDALQVSQAEKNDYYNNLQAIMDTMDFYGGVNIVGSTSGTPLVRRLDNQGSNNGTNETFQLDPYTWYNTNRIANGAGVQSTHYAVADGTLAFESRLDKDALMGHSVGGGQKEWGVVDVPIPGSNFSIQMGSYYTEDCADKSSLNSGTASQRRTKVEAFEWSADVVFAVAYNSDPATRFSPIVKTEISTT